MAKGVSLYDVLGLKHDCSTSDIRTAYKQLAMKWHPDKCAASDFGRADLAKTTFQAIQEAYSVLSNENRRFWYDTGLDDTKKEENHQECTTYGMEDFLKEMAALMTVSTAKPNGVDNFEELKVLFMEILGGEKCVPPCNQKRTFANVGDCCANSRSSSDDYCHFNGMHVSGTRFEGFETTSFRMGESNASPCSARKWKKRSARK